NLTGGIQPGVLRRAIALAVFLSGGAAFGAEKVFDFGAANLAQGAGKVIEIAAGFLNQTENLNKLIDLGRRFLKSAYDLAMSLLGKVGLDVIKEKITSWVDDKLQNREQLMSKWIKDLYRAEDTTKALQQKLRAARRRWRNMAVQLMRWTS
ncbi:MAG: hypothetical protein HC853_06045, partial [Anaerolineae bacterium]|nr:hypothetical protein [Anaerolineae bacterium]